MELAYLQAIKIIGEEMKKGFTIIETVVAISIILTTSAFGIAKITNFNKVKNNFDFDMSKSMILGMINDGKQNCRVKSLAGYIFFDDANNRVSFYCGGRKVDSFTLPKGISIYNINTELNRVDIDFRGFTSDACTITLKDGFSNFDTITICVGTGYAEIQ
jgi:prepilin-type N-terminal cleavage/methylation domain-containing protein